MRHGSGVLAGRPDRSRPRGGIEGFRGSGYLVAPGLVLTAAHVVAGASAVRVRLDVGQPTEIDVQAERWWADPDGHNGTDLAVVMIPADVTAGREVEPARFGRISDCTAVLAVQAFGFPRFKLRGSRCQYRRAGGVPGSGAGDRARAGGGQPPSGHPGGLPGRPAARRPRNGRVLRRGRACRGLLSGPAAGSSGWWPSITPARAPAGSLLGASTGPTNSCRNLTLTGW